MKKNYWYALLMGFVMLSCAEPPAPQGYQVAQPDANPSYQGFYVLNEGTMGANKATLDNFNYTTGYFENDIFPKRNPSIIGELGDVGMAMQLYGSKLYVLLNGSNLVEIISAQTGRHLAAVEIPNVRAVTFADGKAYFTSFAGPIGMGNEQLGYVVEMDTTTYELGRKVIVGRQPEEMVVKDGKLYVANSGGYTPENYDNTVSVVDLATFTEVEKIPVAINLHRMFMASNGTIYVSSRGNYADVAPNLYALDTETKTAVALNKGVTSYAIKDDVAYIIDIQYAPTMVFTYYKLSLNTGLVHEQSFLSPEVQSQIVYPYALGVHPHTGDIVMMDAVDFVTPGRLFYLDANGKLLWDVVTGDIPTAVAFYGCNF